ncbi:VOC family protein [Alkalihalobacillus sp. AL-G]|uniref:VOC family protein n=1 Tax=Alkalihalobacillus sp. AL-G TaxID=2926399 RepID=UPI00272A9705|nr:VOC family protein [Alkalihalobacillus sp. AL-G]WLD94250.1 VOC family protein [Alkalihalobacillus sp. AL-G]
MEKTKSPINRMGAVFLHVEDLKESAAWYAKLLGKETPEIPEHSPVHYFDLGNGGFLMDDNRNNDPGIRPVFMLHTDDIDEAYAYVKENGGKIVREIERDDMVSFFNFQDPFGTIMMVCEQHG